MGITALFLIHIIQLYLVHPVSEPETNYNLLLESIQTKRLDLRNTYLASEIEEKDSILKLTKNYLEETLVEDIFNYWYGTPWDFNGTTNIPNQGSIACGYFVTTTLKHLGFNIPRFKFIFRLDT